MVRAVEPGAGTNKTDVRLQLRAEWQAMPVHLGVFCRLFPDDPQHRTYLNLYEGERLRRQVIFGQDSPTLDYRTGDAAPQGVLAVIGEFFAEGVHHKSSSGRITSCSSSGCCCWAERSSNC